MTNTAYSIDLGFQNGPSQLNQAGSDFSEVDSYATFGAETYPTALAALDAISNDQLKIAGACPGGLTIPTSIGHGVTATETTSCGPSVGEGATYSWQAQGWTISVSASRADGGLVIAKGLADYLNDHHVPGSTGNISIGLGVDAGASTVEWRVGASVLKIGSTASTVVRALDLAAAMSPYPGPPPGEAPGPTQASVSAIVKSASSASVKVDDSGIVQGQETSWLGVARESNGDRSFAAISVVIYAWTGARWEQRSRIDYPDLALGDLYYVSTASLTGSRDPDFLVHGSGADTQYFSVISDVGGSWHTVPFDYGDKPTGVIDASGTQGNLVAGQANSCGCASGPETYIWFRYGPGIFVPTAPPGIPLPCTADALLIAAHTHDFPSSAPEPAPMVSPYPTSTPYGQLASLEVPACDDGWALAKGFANGTPVLVLFNQGEVYSAGNVDRGFQAWLPIAVSTGKNLLTVAGNYALPTSVMTTLARRLGLNPRG